MNIGSRPAKRKTGGGIETLRAIPWIFAWTQTRFHLPVWLGVGEAMEEARCSGCAADAGRHVSSAFCGLLWCCLDM
jgi:phosphoenolpyruvate carboxylase